ncbi:MULTISPECIES: hypothetical protein [Stappiaceae]|uniref:hypothetical protein n=1 Tax=Stappiaceae TaxID=2821832 RepID=UPI001ADCA2B9|nr:hypothetical protein [Labrenzia sp. R4_2]MBO9420304.1 hypothetical protein [Labrenzia sp. R4_2]
MADATQNAADIAALGARVASVEALVNTPAIEEADTGTHYQTSYTYFYVPAAKGSTATSADDSGLGAFLRLGGYSDVETASITNQTATSYFPEGYLSDRGDAAGSNAETAQYAAGPNSSTSNGILLACDGRILVKAGEEMYLESKKYRHKASGTYDIKATGKLTADSDDQIEIKSGQNKNVSVSAGNGTGDFDLNVKESTTKINGNDFKKTTGTTRAVHHGATETYFLGGKLDVTLAGTFTLNTGVHMLITAGLFGSINISASLEISLAKVSVIGFDVEFKNHHTDLCTGEVTIRGVSTESTAAESRLAAIENNIATLSTGTAALSTKAASIESNQKAIQADVGNLKADVRNVLFV